MAVSTYTKSGTKATTPVKLDKDVFGVEVKNHNTLKDAYVAHLANRRTSSAVVKTRGLVSGGGRKPWKQKGTGRARFGSSRNPIWRGGGIVFGPTGQENYTHKLSSATKKNALKQALTIAAQESKIIVIESIVADGKTKSFLTLLNKLNVSGNVLIVTDSADEKLYRSTNNLANVKVCTAAYVNVYDVINADSIVVAKEALKGIEERLKSQKRGDK